MGVNSAADLLGDVVFLGLCEAWCRDGRCDLAMVDYLLEQGLEEAAETARWAATYRERPVFLEPDSDEIGPTPREVDRGWTWWWVTQNNEDHSADDLLTQTAYSRLTDEQKKLEHNHPTFAHAIAALLDHYRPVKETECPQVTT